MLVSDAYNTRTVRVTVAQWVEPLAGFFETYRTEPNGLTMRIERHFLGWDGPALPLAADFLIDRYAHGGKLDLSHVILVFPGRRAARRMLELLVERCEDRYPALIPPRMVTFKHFPELLYPQQKQLADDLTQLLVWKRAIGNVPPREIRPALTMLPPDNSLPSWMKLCESLRRQHDELAAEGLDFGDVFKALAGGSQSEETARWKALRRIQAEYLTQMDTLQLWDRQTARLIAVEQNECTTQHDIVLIGTVDMNGIVKKMLSQVADRSTAVVYAPESLADSFDDWGCLIPKQWETRSIDVPHDCTVVADDPQDQADAVVRHLAALNGERRADEIAIAVADDGLVPVIRQSLARAGISGRWPVGAMVRTSRPWRLLDSVASHLATAQSGVAPDFATLADLVRHPDISEFIEKQLTLQDVETTHGWLAALDFYQAEHLQTVPGRMLGPRPRAELVQHVCDAVELLLSYLSSAEPAAANRNQDTRGKAKATTPHQPQLFATMNEEGVVHEKLTRRLKLNDWAAGVLELLNAIYKDYDIGENPQRDRSMCACLDALNELNETLSAIPSEVMPKCTAAQAIPVLLMQIGDETIPAPADEDAVELMGWLELPLDDSPIVTVAGFNEGRIPQSASSDVFLPNTVRSQLGLTDNTRRYARDAWALESLLSNRQQLRMVAGQRDVQGDPLTPSRLWFAGDPAEIPQRVLWFYQENSAAESSTAEEPTDQGAQLPSTASQQSDFIVSAPSVVPNIPEYIPVTHFRDFIDCPYRYLLRRELRLSSIEDKPREMDGRLFGNLIHAVLNRFGESDLIHATGIAPIEHSLIGFLHQEAKKQFGTKLSATVAVQLQMAEERLRAFAKWQARQTSDGWVIRYAEQQLECNFCDSLGRPLRIRGRIDRIDHHQQSDEWRVLDYKTSEQASSPQQTHRKKGDWVDLQLPLYRLLVHDLHLEGAIQLGYINLPGDLKQVDHNIADWTTDDLASADEKARQLATDIRDLRIESIRPATGRMMKDELARICQDTVVDRRFPWLDAWPGRVHSET